MNNPKVTVIDYGVGNLLSVSRGLEQSGATVIITSEPRKILASDRVVLPGVGAFPKAMEELHNRELVSTLQDFAKTGKAFLAICLGMQLLLDVSHEFGVTPGLSIIPGEVVALPTKSTNGDPLKIPHIGWSALHYPVNNRNWLNTLLQNTNEKDSAYFVHSFMAEPSNQLHRIADTSYGGTRISAVIARDNVTGCQFHPEKSGEVGLKILRRFVVETGT